MYQKQLEKSDDMKFQSIVTEVHKFLIPRIKTYQHYVLYSSYLILLTIKTQVKKRTQFYYAEDYHQQYLSKNPDGFCGLKNSGISCPVEELSCFKKP